MFSTIGSSLNLKPFLHVTHGWQGPKIKYLIDIIDTSRFFEDLKIKAYLYHSNPSSSNKIMLETAKKSLDKAYLDAQVDFVNGKMMN